jgi:hypothetical protein
MKNLCVIFFLLVITLTNLQAQTTSIQEKLTELSRLGIQHKYLDETTIELSDSLTGYRSIKTMKEISAEEIYSWARSKDIPVIDFNPALIDTSKWTGWYDYWTFVRVGNFVRIPTPVFDFDHNSYPEVYGPFGIVGNSENRIFEVYPNGSSIQRYNYFTPAPIISTNIVDVDNNGLMEIVFQRETYSYFFEQTDTTSLPINLKFIFNKHNGYAHYLSDEIFADMDGDSLLDYVHRGSDTSLTQVYNFYVSEYNPEINNFEKKWFFAPDDDFYDGFDVGDYDGDNQMEFILSSIWGQIRIVENTGDDTYTVNFLDSLPLVNMYYQTSGDLDEDGKREFFIGATMGDGNWTVMFEKDADNTYSPKIILHLISGGSLDDPTYMTDDIDDDGKIELAILSGGYLYIFKSDGDNSYYLWYLKKGPASFSFNFVDMNGDGTKDILWSILKDDQWMSNIYKASEFVSIEDEEHILPNKFDLLQNYPNPFNPYTVISYLLPVRAQVSIIVYDLLGREVATLVNEEKEVGRYSVKFDGSKLSSGLYIYKLQTEFGSISKKMLLIK